MKTNIFWALLCNKILCWAVISNGDHVPGFDFQHKACSEFDLEWKLCCGVQFWHHQVPGLRFHYPPTTSFLHRSNPTACTPPTFSPLLPPATTCNISPSHTLNPSSPTSCHPHPSHLRTLPPLLSFKYQAVGGGLEGEAHFLYRIYNRTRKVLWEFSMFFYPYVPLFRKFARPVSVAVRGRRAPK